MSLKQLPLLALLATCLAAGPVQAQLRIGMPSGFTGAVGGIIISFWKPSTMT